VLSIVKSKSKGGGLLEHNKMSILDAGNN